MATPSLYEMLTFSFSGELPLEQVSERDQLILSVMDNMQRIINCRAGTLAHLPDYGLPDLSLIHQGMAAGIHSLMRQIEETLLRYEPRLNQIQVELLPQPRPGHLNYLIHAQLPDTGWRIFSGRTNCSASSQTAGAGVLMASNANFISQFVMGGDPCTYKESGELQAEMSKLTHPARPDVDWRQVEKLSLALFRQNGVELQTLVCYVLAITRRQGLAGMADGLGSLDILLQRWADFWPVQVHSRISLLGWVTEKMQQALRTLDIQYQDLPQIYRCVQHLSAIETTLQQCELWHMTKLDLLAGQFRNTALRLERPLRERKPLSLPLNYPAGK